MATRLRARGIKSRRSLKAAGYHIRKPLSIEDLPAVKAREEARAHGDRIRTQVADIPREDGHLAQPGLLWAG